MEMALGILRSSINAFSNGYPSFTSIASLLLLPSSASLLSQALVSSSCTTTPVLGTLDVAPRLSSLLRAAAAAGFPPPASTAFSSALLRRTASPAIFASFFTLPFVLTFSLLAKSCVVLVIRDGALRRPRPAGLPAFSSLLLPYSSVLPTHLLGSFLALSADAAALALALLVLSAADALALDLSARLPLFLFLAVLHSAVVASATAICNMATVVAAMENRRGHSALLKACLLVRGRATTALCLVLPANLGMAAAEALFQVRVVREYRSKGRDELCSLVWEAFSIAYLHALLVVLDVIADCMFYEKCCCQRNLYSNNWEDERAEEEEEGLEIDGEKKVYLEV